MKDLESLRASSITWICQRVYWRKRRKGKKDQEAGRCVDDGEERRMDGRGRETGERSGGDLCDVHASLTSE